MSQARPRQPPEVLAARLHSWLTKEMQFQPQGSHLASPVPTVDQLKKLCRGSQMPGIIDFLVNNIHSVQTVKKVKGNLKLKSASQRQGYKGSHKTPHQYDDERDRLLAQKDRLEGEIRMLKLQTGQVRDELERMEKDIQTAETEYQRDMEGMREMGRKACVLQMFCHRAGNFTAAVNTFSDRLQERTDTLLATLKGVDKALHSREEEQGPGQQEEGEEGGEGDRGGRRTTWPQADLETSTARDVRVTCEYIGKLLEDTLQGNFSSDRTSLDLKKEQLWKQVETTLAKHSIELIVNALVQQTQKEAQQLNEHTEQVDIQKDAEKLRFKYEKGAALRDLANQPTVLHSVHQLLEECQLQHVLRFVETKKHTNDALAHRESLEQTKAKINPLLERQFKQLPGHVEMATNWVQSLLEMEGDKAARDVYTEELVALRDRVQRENRTRDSLLALYSKIQHFQQLVNCKQNLIQVVAKQNAGAKYRITSQHLRVVDYIRRSFLELPAATSVLTGQLKGSVVEEMKKMTSLSMPYLMQLSLDSETKVGQLDMSINFTTHPTAISLRTPLHTTLQYLRFPHYKAPECILQHCLWLKDSLDQLQREGKERCERYSSIQMSSGVIISLDILEELCDKVHVIDKDEVNKLLPVLQKRMTRAARASTDTISLKDHMQSWWEQPAQFSTPWLTVENQTYKQWFNRWKILTTNIRQLDLQLESQGSTQPSVSFHSDG